MEALLKLGHDDCWFEKYGAILVEPSEERAGLDSQPSETDSAASIDLDHVGIALRIAHANKGNTEAFFCGCIGKHGQSGIYLLAVEYQSYGGPCSKFMPDTLTAWDLLNADPSKVVMVDRLNDFLDLLESDPGASACRQRRFTSPPVWCVIVKDADEDYAVLWEPDDAGDPVVHYVGPASFR